MGGIGNNEPDLPFLDLYDSAAAVAPANITRVRRSGNLLQVSTDGGAYQTIATGIPGANNILNTDEPPLPFLDIQDGGEPVSNINRTRLARITGNLASSIDGAAYSTLSAGVPGANNIVPTLQPMELVDIWDSAAPVAPVNTMRIARRAGALMLSTDCGAYITFSSSTPSLPGTPVLWYSAQNIDGLNNSSLVDGQTIGTWKNLGSLGAAGDLLQAVAGLRPQYVAVASLGKMNNKSCVRSDGTRWMQSAALGPLAQPTLIAAIAMATTLAGGVTDISDGRTAQRNILGRNAALTLAFAGSFVTSANWTVNKYQSINCNYNGAASVIRLDGSASGALAAGAQSLDGVTVLADLAGGSLWTGDLIELPIYNGGGQPTAAAVEAALTAFYGATPQ